MNEAREEINVQKNIVRSQNIRLNEVEEELLDHKTKNEHLSFELIITRIIHASCRSTGM